MRITAKLYRGGKLVAERSGRNTPTKEGLAKVLDLSYNDEDLPHQQTWYWGIYTSGAITLTSTMAALGVVEYTGYDEAERAVHNENVSATLPLDGKAQIGFGTTEEFTFNEDVTITGAFLTTDETKGGTAGELFGGALFDSPLDVEDGDQLTVAYQPLFAQADDTIGNP